MRFLPVVAHLSLAACSHARALPANHQRSSQPLIQETISKGLSANVSISPQSVSNAALDVENDPAYWLANIDHQGVAAFNNNPSGYTVFRNVKDYGAKGKTQNAIAL